MFLRVATKCYLPAIRLFEEIVAAEEQFKVTLGMSGTFLEQADRYNPDVIKALQRLFDAGGQGVRVEFLDETYYHSLAGLFADPKKQEFRDQVSLHRDAMRQFFGIRPTAFCNTALIYDNHIAQAVAEMGYRVILCEERGAMLEEDGMTYLEPRTVFRAKGSDLVVLPRHRALSNEVAFRFSRRKLSPEQYAQSIADTDGFAVLLGYDFEHIGEHIWEDTGIFSFWRNLPRALAAHENVVLSTPSEIAERFGEAECPEIDIPGSVALSRTDAAQDTFGWLGSITQYELFKNIEDLEGRARRAGGGAADPVAASDHIGPRLFSS